jgi:hypothetical protein
LKRTFLEILENGNIGIKQLSPGLAIGIRSLMEVSFLGQLIPLGLISTTSKVPKLKSILAHLELGLVWVGVSNEL